MAAYKEPLCELKRGKWILLFEGVEETVPSYREEERPVGNIQALNWHIEEEPWVLTCPGMLAEEPIAVPCGGASEVTCAMLLLNLGDPPGNLTALGGGLGFEIRQLSPCTVVDKAEYEADYFWVGSRNCWESLDAEMEMFCCGVQVKI
ncbi:hypothetical protein Q9233_009969 [Columba guinea]|nr:hypothetical protein Q9233_009969 [Columba guinea]